MAQNNIVIGCIVAALLLFSATQCQRPRAQACEEGTYGCEHDKYHERYETWRDRNGGSCCAKEECRPVRANRDIDGNWTIYVPERKKWIPVPPKALLEPDKLGDGRSHACTSKPGNYMLNDGDPVVYCFSPALGKG